MGLLDLLLSATITDKTDEEDKIKEDFIKSEEQEEYNFEEEELEEDDYYYDDDES